MLSLSRTTSVLRTLYSNCNIRRVQRTARVSYEKDAKDFYDDFFGIEYDSVAEKKMTKYETSPMVNQREQAQASTDQPSDWMQDSDQILQMNFGTIRLDSMNEPCGNWQSKSRSSSTVGTGLGYIDAQYFSEVTRGAMDQFVETDGKRQNLDDSNQIPIEENTTEIGTTDSGSEVQSMVKRNSVSTQSRDDRNDLNYFDELFVNQQMEDIPFGDKPNLSETVPKSPEMMKSFREKEKVATAPGTNVTPVKSYSKRQEIHTEKSTAPSTDVTPAKKSSKRQENMADNNTDRPHLVPTTTSKNNIADAEMPKTAFEMSQEIRAEGGEKSIAPLDSKGFLNPKSQVADLTRESRDELVTRLKRSILYDENDILAIDKPYGLSTQDGTDVQNSIDSLLPRLAASLSKDLTLYQVHRLDKNTTGVMLFAKTAAMQKRLIDLFRQHRVRKRYWVLTKGIPSPNSGVIDIPMVEASVEGRYRMVLAPDDPKIKLLGKRSSKSSSRAVTKFTVLDSNHGVALVECEPMTGLKHQVRCHLGYALNCPVVGDHKYSHHLKRVPQKLYPETLQFLGIRQAKVRHLPLHLHSSSVYIPELMEGKNVFIRSKLPQHFMENMKKLKIKPPRK